VTAASFIDNRAMNVREPSVSGDYEISSPKPCALVESLRSVGYSLPTAVADILDNSIAAHARNIWIDFHWAGPDSWVSILDDGDGMDDGTLAEAMRPGSANPLDSRRPDDLGRFGLGLKTASFSQCRKLTVWSKKKDQRTAGRCWDLDYVAAHDEWRLLKAAAPDGQKPFGDLCSLTSGTLVLWEQLDRAVDNTPASSQEAHSRFLRLIEDVCAHLGMIFHRFLEGSASLMRGPLRIFVNGRSDVHLVKPWNPFVVEGASSKETPAEPTSVAGHRVSVRGYVLPHKDRLSAEQFARAAGPQGWVAQQGFYIYRNDRIIVTGDWLRLGRVRPWAKEEQYKLARLSIDIPNVMDEAWSLDIKKSTARPPAAIRERLTGLAESVRTDARQVFAHRGDYGPRPPAAGVIVERPWIAATRSGRTVYLINRKHPVVAAALTRVGVLSEHVKPMLRLIEETVPVQKIWLDTAESADENAVPYEGYDEDTVLGDIRIARDFLAHSQSITSKDALRAYLLATEPFRRYAALVERALQER
jgi:hypothetical protein